MANRTRHLRRGKHRVVNILPMGCFGYAQNWLLERSSLCQETESFRIRQMTKYEDDSVLTERETRTAGWTQEAFLAKWCIYWVQKTQWSRSRGMPLLLGTSGYPGPPGVVWNCLPPQASGDPIVFTRELTSNYYMQRIHGVSEIQRWSPFLSPTLQKWVDDYGLMTGQTTETDTWYQHPVYTFTWQYQFWGLPHGASPGPHCTKGRWEPIT